MQAPQLAWDSPAVLRSYLERATEPVPHDQHDTDVMVARLALTKLHLNDLRDIHTQLSPRQSDTLEVERAGASFRFKVLAWKTFQIHQLPIEILQYIFRLVIRPRIHYKDIDLNRLRLTWVCHHWRVVALADPLLWNVSYFRGPSNWERVTQFMHRAGNALLEIHVSDVQRLDVYTRDVASKISLPHMRHLLLVLSQKWHQVRAVSFALHDTTTSAFLLDTLSANTQFHNSRNLEVLVLDVPTAGGGAYRRPAAFPGLSPKLYHCNINGAGVDFVPLSWNCSLTKLTLSRVPPHLLPTSERFYEILASSLSLISLTLDQFSPKMSHNHAASSRKVARLLKLKTLVIGNLTGTEIQFIMSHFTAPNVRYLNLCYLTERNDGSLAEFLEGRFPHVTSLFMEDFQFAHTKRAARAFVKWLDTMPQIVYLKLADFPDNDISLSWFCGSAVRPPGLKCGVDDHATMRVCEDVRSCTCLGYAQRREVRATYGTKGGRRVLGKEGWEARNMLHLHTALTTHRDPLALASPVDDSSLPRADLVLPRLSHLCVENIRYTDILAIVDGRRRAGNPLSDLTLSHPYVLPAIAAEALASRNTKVHFLQAQDSYALMLDDY
ncbi:hypothetical protein PHLGIDRAFT_18389 [Phlebiopsis gigantea 11061_1 CR5-6]|uniref:Uncharacterized protein n=1 Tax=Phlebiopsis gigantea (strain 11061_1 CR5-6) TaxID=745531 RepID=A0A0C3SBR7_PHLG1|nr:hypothetical protein PHLGIDRAFT_18389 [Phlebiopsis gigantea 11061_1 CR5-6]